jgi:hypothetical protein
VGDRGRPGGYPQSAAKALSASIAAYVMTITGALFDTRRWRSLERTSMQHARLNVAPSATQVRFSSLMGSPQS